MHHVHVCSPLSACVLTRGGIAQIAHEGVLPGLAESGDAAWFKQHQLQSSGKASKVFFFVDEECRNEGAEGVL